MRKVKFFILRYAPKYRLMALRKSYFIFIFVFSGLLLLFYLSRTLFLDDKLVYLISSRLIKQNLSLDLNISNSTLSVAVNNQDDFQSRLLAGFPLSCYHGKEGLFPKKYKKLINLLSEYADVHHNMSTNSRTLVWQCSSETVGECGGLADRIKGMTFALLLAVFSHRRLILDWDKAGEGIYFQPNMINWRDQKVYDIIQNPLKESKVVKFKVYAGDSDPYLLLPVDNWQKYLNTISGSKEYVVLVTNVEVLTLVRTATTQSQQWIIEGLQLAGLLNQSDHNLNDILGITLRYLFKLNDTLLEEVSKAVRSFNLTSKTYTGLHIRTGFIGMNYVKDSMGSKKLLKNKEQWKVTLDCAVSIANKLVGSRSNIILATDSNLVKEMASTLYGNRFRTSHGYIVHVDRIREPNSQVKEGILNTLIDLILLAQSYVLVRGHSGFSWVAGLLCGLPNEHLINGLTCQPDNLNVIHP